MDFKMKIKQGKVRLYRAGSCASPKDMKRIRENLLPTDKWITNMINDLAKKRGINFDRSKCNYFFISKFPTKNLVGTRSRYQGRREEMIKIKVPKSRKNIYVADMRLISFAQDAYKENDLKRAEQFLERYVGGMKRLCDISEADITNMNAPEVLYPGKVNKKYIVYEHSP